MKFILLIISLTSLDLNTCQAKDPVELNSIVVLGKVPGPDLWKVTNNENTLWILGTVTPLPKRLDWNPNPVEDVIKESTHFLLPPSVKTNLGFFQKLSLATSTIGLKKNPKKQKLSEVLPLDVYQKWLEIKKVYFKKSKKFDNKRPLFVAHELYEKALSNAKLSTKPQVRKKVTKLAKKHKLKMTQPVINVELSKPKAALKNLKKSSLNDKECFVKTIESVEKDIETMIERANAWSYGEIDRIKAMPFVDNESPCVEAVLRSQFAEDLGINNMDNEMRKEWMKSVQFALENNKSSVAVVSMNRLVGDNNLLDELKSLGYKVSL